MSESRNKEQIFEALFIENYKDMVSFTSNAIRNRDLANDLVHETFLVAQRKIDSVLSSPSPRGWLFNTLKNVIKNFNKQRIRLINTAVSLEENDGIENIGASTIFEYKGIIDDESLQMLFWAYCEDIPYAEIADQLGISLETCRKKLQRARELLRDELSKINKL